MEFDDLRLQIVNVRAVRRCHAQPGIFGHHRNVRLQFSGTNLTVLELHVKNECASVNPQSDFLSSCVIHDVVVIRVGTMEILLPASTTLAADAKGF